jgi:hypothetical protein
MSCPRVHVMAAKRVPRYVAKAPGAGLWFCRLESTEPHDADFAADPIMRKSTSGLLFNVNGAPTVWRSKL